MRSGFLVCALAVAGAALAGPAPGPLRASRENPRYFADHRGNVVYLTGSHVWNNLVDMGPSDPPPPFDFKAYLAWMDRLGHNFMRLWAWELVRWDTAGNNPRHRKAPYGGRFAGRGRFRPIVRRSSHITVVLTERELED